MRMKDKNGKNYYTLSLIFILAFTLSSVLVIPISAVETIVSVNDTGANFGDLVKLPINVTNAIDIGSMDIQLKYDSTVLTFKEAEKGNLSKNSLMQLNTTSDMVKIGLIDGVGINGNGSLVFLIFEVCGQSGSTSVLDLDVKANNVTDFSSIPLTVLDAIFTTSGITTENGDENENINTSPTTPHYAGGGGGTKTSPLIMQSPGSLPIILSISNLTAYPNSTMEVPINVEGASGIGSMDITLAYEPAVLNVISVDKGLLTTNSMLQSNVSIGTIKIVLLDAVGITGNGPVAIINFNVIGSSGSNSPLTLNAEANDVNTLENLLLIVNNGTIKINVDKENIGEENVTSTPTAKSAPPSEETTRKQPGFEALFVIVGLLTMTYIMKRISFWRR